MDYLEFEKSIQKLIDKITETKKINNEDKKIDLRDTITNLEDQLKKKRKEVYENLSAWQKVQVSRHPKRPYSMDYIESLTKGNFIELHGDRNTKDDKAMIGGWGTIEKETVMFIGQQ